MLERLYCKCLLRPEDVAPSHDALDVVGAFNPGAIDLGDEIVLLVRVAERPKEKRDGFTALPRWIPGGAFTIDWTPNDALTFVDPRVVEVNATGVTRLTFFSHLIVVRSKDGRSIDAIDQQRFTPETHYETYGVEDPRVTRIGGRCYFTYVAVSPHGAATALASTQDFRTFERHGIIFPAENKDVLLFPEPINGEYVAFHRPNPSTHFTPPEMWLARSKDLIHWGRHEPFHGGKGQWETGRIGGGAPPFKVEGGWCEIYHGNEKNPEDPGVGVYSAGALLLDLQDPQQIRARTSQPIMTPEADFEQEGFVPNVVFPTGIVERENRLMVYYGAADAHTGLVEFSRDQLLNAMH